jgi:hypothetical protein
MPSGRYVILRHIFCFMFVVALIFYALCCVGIVDELVDASKVLSRSIELAESHAAKATDRSTYFAIKYELFKGICEVLRKAEVGDEHPMSPKKSKL